MNKKGFTLLELLAALVIMAIISVITVPRVIHVVKDSEQDTVKSTAHLLAKAAQDHYSNELMDSGNTGKVNLADDTIMYNGDRPEKGYAFFDEEGRAYIKMYYKGYCVSRYQDGKVDLKETASSNCEVADVVTLTLYLNGGTITAGSKWSIGENYASISVEVSTKLDQVPEITRTGYTFLGWYNENDKVTNISGTIVENMNLNAKWAANTYVVKIEKHDYTFSNTDDWRLVDDYYAKDIVYDTVYGTLPTVERTGYTFKGWATTGGVTVTEDTVLKLPSNHSILPIWESKIYIVTLKYNDGVTADVTQQVKYDSTYGALPKPTRTGYTFLGWYTDETEGVVVTADTPVTRAENHTVYARWNLNLYTITLNSNSGVIPTTEGWTVSGTKVTKNMSYGEAYGVLPVATRTGYTFNGWFLTNGNKVESTSTLTVESDQIIYAQWTANTYTVTFVKNDINAYGNGTTVYFNPTTGLMCTESEAVSVTGTTSGCMKWYVFLDSEDATTVNLILDHNTTAQVAWNQTWNQHTADTALAQLAVDTEGWKQTVNGVSTSLTPRLITAEEIVEIVGLARGYSWTSTDDVNYIFHTKKTLIPSEVTEEDIYMGPAGTNNYAWLFDNTEGYTTYGCNVSQDGVTGYWTTTVQGTYQDDIDTWTDAWYVSSPGGMVHMPTNFSYVGIRPVITISKDLINSQELTKEVTYDSTYGQLPSLVKDGYTFTGWYTSTTGGTNITNDSVVKIASNVNVYPQFVETVTSGEAYYFNPTTGLACTEAEAVSTVETKSGCMKWYSILDTKFSDTVTLLLDHNTTKHVVWNSDTTATEPNEVMTQLTNDTTGWIQTVDGTSTNLTARLISAEEIISIAPVADGYNWSKSMENTIYHLHDGMIYHSNISTENIYQGDLGTNNYGWLFDNTTYCNLCGCNQAYSDAGILYGYWTSTYNVSGRAWMVFSYGVMIPLALDVDSYDGSTGVRPVITVDKAVFE